MPDRKFGRISPVIPPHENPDVLHFGAFLKPKLKPPPYTINWNKSRQIYPMSLNDRLSCCGPAACGHQIQAWTSNTQDSPVILSDADILKCYQDVSGYNGSPQSDQGVLMQDLFDYWRTEGIGGNKIIAAASIDPSQVDRLKWAIVIFGGAQIGVKLPQSALDQTDHHQPWSVVHNSPIEGGHDIAVVGYDSSGLVGVSWGQVVRITWPFVQEYTEEAWTVVDPAWIDEHGLSPVQLNIGSMMTDIALL